MPTRYIIFSIAFMLLHLTVFSQKDYEYGYVITSKNDTLRGLIKDRKSGSFGGIYKKIRFKDGGFVAKKFSPYDIKGYAVGNDTYHSMWLSSSRSVFREVYVSKRNTGKKRFLKLVVEGPLSLYYLEFRDQEAGINDYVELLKLNHSDELVRASQGILGLKKKLLSSYLQNCPEVVAKINSSEIKTAREVAVFYNDYCGE
jgi:hypothetical protein